MGPLARPPLQLPLVEKRNRCSFIVHADLWSPKEYSREEIPYPMCVKGAMMCLWCQITVSTRCDDYNVWMWRRGELRLVKDLGPHPWIKGGNSRRNIPH